MSAFRSAPGGLGRVGWRFLGAVVLVVWLAPAGLGLAMGGIVRLLGRTQLGEDYLFWGAVAALFAWSPLFTWAGFALIGIGAAFLLRRAAFGWASALILGGFAGSSLALHTQEITPVLIGAYIALLLRLILAIRAPEVF
jgi:hypothetical protein